MRQADKGAPEGQVATRPAQKKPSKDKGDECAQAIQEKETQIRERDEKIRYYQRKLDNAEALDEQNAKLAAEVSEKENKLQEVSRQLLHLQQEMKTAMAKNALMKKQVAEDQTKHKDKIKNLKAKYRERARSDAAVEFIVVSDKDSEQNTPSIKEEFFQLRSRIATLEVDLEKSVAHSKGQSREILSLKQQVQGAEVSNILFNILTYSACTLFP